MVRGGVSGCASERERRRARANPRRTPEATGFRAAVVEATPQGALGARARFSRLLGSHRGRPA
jgi:hypothetical protein